MIAGDILERVASGQQIFWTVQPDTPPDEPRDWPAGTYDPEMHRFAAKLGSALGPRQS